MLGLSLSVNHEENMTLESVLHISPPKKDDEADLVVKDNKA